MVFLFILFTHFNSIAAELKTFVPYPLFIPEISESAPSFIPVPFFIDNENQCVFLPPFFKGIWDKKSLISSYQALSLTEKSHISKGEKLCLRIFSKEKMPVFSWEGSIYQFIPIVAPSIKRFLLAQLKKQGISLYSLKNLLLRQKIIISTPEEFKILQTEKNIKQNQKLKQYDEKIAHFSQIQDSFTKELAREERHYQSLLTSPLQEKKKSMLRQKCYKNIITFQELSKKKYEEKKIQYKISLKKEKNFFRKSSRMWKGFFAQYPLFKKDIAWEKIYSSLLPPPFLN